MTDDTYFWQDPHIDGREVRHLVLVVHGMGRQLEPSGKYRENIRDMRQTLQDVLANELHWLDATIAVLPIEWHTVLHQHVDDHMERITLKNCSAMRVISNEYLGDVLYYFSEHYQKIITQAVTERLNATYQQFMEQYPQFDGSVALLGFSLGGMCCYDILAHQPDGVSGRHATDRLQVPQLVFKPKHLFTLGSPIAAILLMRGWSANDLQLPRWCRHHNIYHPCDPMGYRLEPLISEQYANIPAVTIDHLPDQSRKGLIFDWVKSPRPGAFIPKVGQALRALSTLTSYVYGSGGTADNTEDRGQDADDSDYEQDDETEEKVSLSTTLENDITETSMMLSNGEEAVEIDCSLRESCAQNVRENTLECGQHQDGQTYQHLMSSDGEEDVWWSSTEDQPRKHYNPASRHTDNMAETSVADDHKMNEAAAAAAAASATVLKTMTTLDMDTTAAAAAVTAAGLLEVDPMSLPTSTTPVVDSPDASQASTASSDSASDHWVDVPGLEDYVHIPPDPHYHYATDDQAPLDRRIDFVLHEPRMRTLNEYVIGIRAHFSYWRNRDLMRYLARCLGPSTPPGTPITETSLSPSPSPA